MVQNILDYLEATAADCPDKPAFEDLEHSYTFAQVLGNAKRIGSALLQVLPQNAPVAGADGEGSLDPECIYGSSLCRLLLYVGRAGATG